MTLSRNNILIRLAGYGDYGDYYIQITLCEVFWSLVGRLLLLVVLTIAVCMFGVECWTDRTLFWGVVGIVLVCVGIGGASFVAHEVSRSELGAIIREAKTAIKDHYCPIIHLKD